jgi:uncharacterized repeat protein (TIGR01451 family)
MHSPITLSSSRALLLASSVCLSLAACSGGSGAGGVDAGSGGGGPVTTPSVDASAQANDSGPQAVKDAGNQVTTGLDSSAAPATEGGSSSAVQDGALLVSTLSFSETTVNPGDTVTATVVFTNNGTTSVDIQNMLITSRPPGGTHTGGPYDDFAPALAAQTLAAGASVTVKATRTFAANDPAGAWDVYSTWEDGANAWHDGPDSSLAVFPNGLGDAGVSADGGPDGRNLAALINCFYGGTDLAHAAFNSQTAGCTDESILYCHTDKGTNDVYCKFDGTNYLQDSTDTPACWYNCNMETCNAWDTGNTPARVQCIANLCQGNPGGC